MSEAGAKVEQATSGRYQKLCGKKQQASKKQSDELHHVSEQKAEAADGP